MSYQLLKCDSKGFKYNWASHNNEPCDAFYAGCCLKSSSCGNQVVVIEPICGREWTEKHENEHADFIPSIEITCGDHRITYRGEIKKGELKKVLRGKL